MALCCPAHRPQSRLRFAIFIEFVERLYGELPTLFKDEDELRALWSLPETRKKLLEALADKGFGDAQLSEIKRMIDAEKSNLFDMLAYIAFALAPITLDERVNARKYSPTMMTSCVRFSISSSVNM